MAYKGPQDAILNVTDEDIKCVGVNHDRLLEERDSLISRKSYSACWNCVAGEFTHGVSPNMYSSSSRKRLDIARAAPVTRTCKNAALLSVQIWPGIGFLEDTGCTTTHRRKLAACRRTSTLLASVSHTPRISNWSLRRPSSETR